MALYIPHSIFHLARLLYVRPETFGPYYVYRAEEVLPSMVCLSEIIKPRQWGGRGPLEAVVPWGKICI